ncbi:hypothetical protein BJV77DRAFT_1126994 [Russula vinacea]|nr:hypothetical protein BJV77DRAFT_1126994 [Russula vinacea]
MVDKHARKSKHGTILFEPFIHTVTPSSLPLSVPQLNHLVSPLLCHSMSSDNPSLSQVTRSKLSLVIGGGAKDSCSLHRWVLLKNSITRSQPNSTPNTTSELLPTYPSDAGDEDEEVCFDVEHDSFIYPDARRLLDSSCSANSDSSESQWFDSLLESLEHEDSDDSHEPLLHVGDEDDEDDLSPLSPSASPMSSTDDLGHPVYNNTPISMPYPVVYPPYNPPLLSPLELQPLNTPLDSIYPPFNVALPYNAEDDIDDLPVPDTVEDLSDDESDALSSPLLPHVYVNADGAYFRHGLELDPLPFAHDSSNPSHMFESVYRQDC